ncbi:sensor histidine kinase [Ekhidna sp. To15]|uniref:sensor histidine kinase n=1 Tax=Ekhidna sp. To15 TaxID=3395267 RepID=UPI003F524B56
MDNTLSNLLMLYAAMILLNAVVTLALWIKRHNSLFRKLFLVWVAIVFNLMCNGIVANASMESIVFIGGGTMIIPTLAVANLLGSLGKFHIRWRLYLTTYIAGLLCSVLFVKAGIPNFTIVCFPIIFGAAFPLVHAPMHILRKKEETSFSLKLLVIVFFISYLHMMDYPFLRMVSSLDLIGFTIGIFLFFAQSILSMAVVTEAVADRSRNLLEQKVSIRTQELNNRNEMLVELNSEKNSLIAIVAHDLKSPLAVIKGFVDLFDRRKLGSDEQKYLNIIDESVERQLKMISNILDTQKMESEDFTIELEPTEIVRPISTMVYEMENVANKKDIALKFHSDEQEVFVNVNIDYFISVIDNLLSNAIKFSPLGENVDVRISIKNRRVFIEVEDNGSGISDEERKLLFKKYKKLSARPTAGESSTGLGLSIAKKHVELMKGRIWCKSKLGEGATFTMAFPVCSADYQVQEAEPSDSAFY